MPEQPATKGIHAFRSNSFDLDQGARAGHLLARQIRRAGVGAVVGVGSQAACLHGGLGQRQGAFTNLASLV